MARALGHKNQVDIEMELSNRRNEYYSKLKIYEFTLQQKRERYQRFIKENPDLFKNEDHDIMLLKRKRAAQ